MGEKETTVCRAMRSRWTRQTAGSDDRQRVASGSGVGPSRCSRHWPKFAGSDCPAWQPRCVRETRGKMADGGLRSRPFRCGRIPTHSVCGIVSEATSHTPSTTDSDSDSDSVGGGGGGGRDIFLCAGGTRAVSGVHETVTCPALSTPSHRRGLVDVDVFIGADN